MTPDDYYTKILKILTDPDDHTSVEGTIQKIINIKAPKKIKEQGLCRLILQSIGTSIISSYGDYIASLSNVEDLADLTTTPTFYRTTIYQMTLIYSAVDALVEKGNFSELGLLPSFINTYLLSMTPGITDEEVNQFIDTFILKKYDVAVIIKALTTFINIFVGDLIEKEEKNDLEEAPKENLH